MKNLEEYHDLHVQSNTLMLANRFEDFGNMCLELYELDPARFFTALELAWQVVLRKTKVRLVNQYLLHNLGNRSDLLALLPAMLPVICNATYYDKTKRHFKVRMCKHFGISVLTGKRVKSDDDSPIKEHLLFCNHAPDFEDFSILTTNNNDFKFTLIESLLINRDHSLLNNNKQSLPFELLIAKEQGFII